MVETALYYGKTKTGSLIHLARTGEDLSLCYRFIEQKLDPAAVEHAGRICPRCRRAEAEAAAKARNARSERLRLSRSRHVEEREYARVLELLEAAKGTPSQSSHGIQYVRSICSLRYLDSVIPACDAVQTSRKWFFTGDRVTKYAARLLRRRASDPICEAMVSAVNQRLVGPILRFQRSDRLPGADLLDRYADTLCALLASQALWDQTEGYPLLAEFLGQQSYVRSRGPHPRADDLAHDGTPPLTSSGHSDVGPTEAEEPETDGAEEQSL